MAKLKIDYQHFYDQARRPRVTVCYIRTGDETFYGVAICAWEDMPCKKVGRKIAFQRALWSYQSRRVHAFPTYGSHPGRWKQILDSTDCVTWVNVRSGIAPRGDFRFVRDAPHIKMRRNASGYDIPNDPVQWPAEA
jgi:hypothetical protein